MDTLQNKSVKLVSCKESLDTGTPQGRLEYPTPLAKVASSFNSRCSQAIVFSIKMEPRKS
ncbi:MAG: hypothetical protein K2N26_09775 [Oscillospiraceae bacterium]|nr:hypothetical protein [Oscillospiraceae bacterium]